VTKKKHKTLTEPVPVEGFLIRLTSQKGRARRLGLMYHKQLYFSTHDQYLVFSRPTNAVPPPPPKLPASSHSAVPSARDIADKTPDTWAVNPYPLADNHIEWLLEDGPGTRETRKLRDEDAADEAQRKEQNLLSCDGYVNLANVAKVRKAKKGATPVDDVIESGSDVDFDEEVDDTTRDDGATAELDIERTLELVMKNGLIIRLQVCILLPVEIQDASNRRHCLSRPLWMSFPRDIFANVLEFNASCTPTTSSLSDSEVFLTY
jgi:hypothetical protein